MKDSTKKQTENPHAAQSNGLSQRIKELADKYNMFRKLTAEHLILKAEIIVDAEDEIGKKYLAEFYALIGIAPESKDVSKHKTIGKASQRLKRFLDRLPDHWTTLYELAKMTEENFLKLVTDGILTPQATWAELRDHITPAKTEKPKKVRPKLTLDLHDVPLAKRPSFVLEMKEMCQKFSVPLPADQQATLAEFSPLPDMEESNDA